jgi:hypothetical protein
VLTPQATSAPREVVPQPAPLDRPAAILRLQREHGNSYVVGLLQRLTAPPFDEAKGDFNFGGEAKEVDVDALGYKALHALQSIHAQKQAEPSAHPQIVFKAGDIEKIDKRVAELEGSDKVEQVLCSESEVKSASAKQAIDFGGVTSCMTIACVFEDGSKAGAHEGLFARVSGGSVNRLKGLVQSKKLAKVLAAGDGMTWTLSGGTLKTNFDDATAALISEDKGAGFKSFLQSQLGAGTVDFTQFAEGRIQVSAGGELKTG